VIEKRKRNDERMRQIFNNDDKKVESPKNKKMMSTIMEVKENLDNNHQQETMIDDKGSNEEGIDYTLPENHTVEQIVQHRKASKEREAGNYSADGKDTQRNLTHGKPSNIKCRSSLVLSRITASTMD